MTITELPPVLEAELALPATRPATRPTIEDLSPTGRRRASFGVWRGRVLRVLVPVLLIVIWQLSSTFGWTTERTVPPPSQIFNAYVNLWSSGDLQKALPISLQRAAFGADVDRA